MKNRRTSIHFAFWIVCILFLVPAAQAAYDPQWSRSQCGEYSANGLKERYVYGANKGWINNDVWDDSSVEGVDCASYVCRCLALPEYAAENKAAPYPYTTDKLYAGVPNTVQVESINNLKQWDLWVYVSGTSKHTGLFKQYSGSYIITREARNAASGIVEGKYSKQYLIDKGARFWRRANWASLVQLPTVQTSPGGQNYRFISRFKRHHYRRWRRNHRPIRFQLGYNSRLFRRLAERVRPFRKRLQRHAKQFELFHPLLLQSPSA
ncbi:MAG TPA: hypothetical protein PK054_11760 [Anaerohalosphaeraceae bacterium]|nr:hypothetical protein [Anaerohalosphaeraceae bacterium]